MTQRMKALYCLLSFIATVGVFPVFVHAQAWAHMPTDMVQTYAGPQTVTPGQVIHVTVEVTESGGISAHNKDVELTYLVDGTETTLTDTATDGLVSFDINAQSNSGMMDFVARVDGVVSKAASVMVSVGQPAVFDLVTKRSHHSQSIDIRSDVITDDFGNAVSDQTLVSLDWIDQHGVKSSENIQLSNSRIIFASRCPAKFKSPLRIRATLKNTDVISSDVSALCNNGSA